MQKEEWRKTREEASLLRRYDMIYARTTSGERRRTRTLDSLSKVLVCFLCVVRLLYRERERERERETRAT